MSIYSSFIQFVREFAVCFSLGAVSGGVGMIFFSDVLRIGPPTYAPFYVWMGFNLVVMKLYTVR